MAWIYRGIGSIQGLADALGFSLTVFYPRGVVGAFMAGLVLIFTQIEGIYRGLVFCSTGALGALLAHWLFAADGTGPAVSIGVFFLIAFAVQYPVFIRIAGVRRD